MKKTLNTEQESEALRNLSVALLDDTVEALNRMGIVPRTQGVADCILLGLLSKQIKVARAVVALSKAGLGDEAFGLCRTAVEIELSLRWLTNKDTEKRCRRFFDYGARNWVDLDRVYRAHISKDGHPSPGNLAQMQKVAQAFKGEHRWWPTEERDGGAKLFSYEPSTRYLDTEGKPTTEEFRYDVVYRLMSYFTHGTVGSLFSHIPEKGDVFRVVGKIASVHESSALVTASLSTLLSVKRVFDFFNYPMPQDLMDRELEFKK